MTTKAKVLAMIQRQDNDITYDDLIYKLEFMKAVEEALNDPTLPMDHDEFMAQLEAEDAAQQAEVDAKGATRFARDKGPYRKNGATKRPKVRARPQSSGKKT